MNSFRAELEELLNRFSRENASNTPDFILAEKENAKNGNTKK
jgi:hypothetical protein